MSRDGVVHLLKLNQSSAILVHARSDSGRPPTDLLAVVALKGGLQIKLRPASDSLRVSCAMVRGQGLESAAWLGLDVSVGRSLKDFQSGSTRLSNQMATL